MFFFFCFEKVVVCFEKFFSLISINHKNGILIDIDQIQEPEEEKSQYGTNN